jgi:hypothetical protein
VAHALGQNTLSQFGVLGDQVGLESAFFVEQLRLNLFLAFFSLLGLFIELHKLLVLLVFSHWAQRC